MNTKIALESLAMDLKRVAIGYYRGSDKMAQRFSEEALKRKAEVDESLIMPYAAKLLEKMEKTFRLKDNKKIAEDSLMLSTLFQNYSQTYLK